MIFLSYSNKDIEKAKVLSSAFENSGFSVWWDKQIPSGRTFDDVIEEALGDAQCVIVLWSSHSVKSEWVRNEAQDGVDRKILIPVLIENVKIPLAFRRIQAANLIGWEGDTENESFKDLVYDVKRLTTQKVKSPNELVDAYDKGMKEKETSESINKESHSPTISGKNNKNTFQSIFVNKKLLIILSIIVLVIVSWIAYNSISMNSETTLAEKSFKTGQFAGIIWMTQNMDYEIPGSSWYYPDLNSQEMQSKFGRLYTWAAAKKACSAMGNGWRLPTDKEWSDLKDYIGGSSTSYQALIEGGSSGFSAVLGGYRTSDGGSSYLGVWGNYWSATAGTGFRDEENAWVYSFNKEFGLHRRYDNNQNYGFSCRCVKDQ